MVIILTSLCIFVSICGIWVCLGLSCVSVVYMYLCRSCVSTHQVPLPVLVVHVQSSAEVTLQSLFLRFLLTNLYILVLNLQKFNFFTIFACMQNFFCMQKDNHQLQWHIKTNNTKRLINWILIVNTKKEIKDLQYQIKLKSIFYNHLTLSKERNICIVGFCTSFLYSVQHLELIKNMTFLP